MLHLATAQNRNIEVPYLYPHRNHRRNHPSSTQIDTKIRGSQSLFRCWSPRLPGRKQQLSSEKRSAQTKLPLSALPAFCNEGRGYRLTTESKNSSFGTPGQQCHETRGSSCAPTAQRHCPESAKAGDPVITIAPRSSTVRNAWSGLII